MATDPYFLERIHRAIKDFPVRWTEKRMFGGDCFMVDDKMVFGTFQGGLMVRTDPAESATLCEHHGAETMIFGGREMSGFLMVSPERCDSEDDLRFWINKALEFNPKAKSSKKK